LNRIDLMTDSHGYGSFYAAVGTAVPSWIFSIMTTRRQSAWVADREEGFTINGQKAEN
jgi:hypothetical protein